MKQFLTGADGVKLSYDFWQGTQTLPGVLLVHQLPANKSSWQPLIPDLIAKRYTVLAIDYRGRGNSEGVLQTAQDFQNIGLDVKAGLDFLRSKGITTIIIIGASIGANHALIAAVEREEVRGVVLLSPGLDYRGVKTEPAATTLQKPVLIVASEDDAYSAMSSKKLYDLLPGKKELKLFSTAGHGTYMFSEESLKPLILNFLKK